MQCAGGFLAGIVAYRITGHTVGLEPQGGYGAISSTFVEVVYTCLLCFIVLNVATTETQKDNQYYGLAIGFTVSASAGAIGGVSGCCLNPAVTVGTTILGALFGKFSHLLHIEIYIFAPLLGAACAAALFRLVRPKEYKPQLDVNVADTPLVAQ